MISRNTTSIMGVMLAPAVRRSLWLGTRIQAWYLTKPVLSDTLLQFVACWASGESSPQAKQPGTSAGLQQARSAMTNMGEQLTFLKNFLRNPTKVGAIAPSSPGLVRMMVDWFDWESIRNVVEFGPGTGVFTEAIVKKLHGNTNFFAIEQSAELVQATRQRCPRAKVYHDSVINVRQLCQQESMTHVDAVICGLPWASFSDSLQNDIMTAMLEVLRPGGRFATFAYWQGLALPAGIRFSRRLQDSFASVERSPTVWKNLPPAFVYRCIR